MLLMKSFYYELIPDLAARYLYERDRHLFEERGKGEKTAKDRRKRKS